MGEHPRRRYSRKLDYGTDERGTPGPFGADPGGTYSGIDTVSRGINDRWLLSGGGNAQLGRVGLNAEATHMRLDSEFASPFGDSESYPRRTTGRGQADMTILPGLDASAGIDLLGERAGGRSSPPPATFSSRSNARSSASSERRGGTTARGCS